MLNKKINLPLFIICNALSFVPYFVFEQKLESCVKNFFIVLIGLSLLILIVNQLISKARKNGRMMMYFGLKFAYIFGLGLYLSTLKDSSLIYFLGSYIIGLVSLIISLKRKNNLKI